MAFRVNELLFVENDGDWAASLQLPPIGPPLTKGQHLISGTRTWEVVAVYDAPRGFVGTRLRGPSPLTVGLILRGRDEPITEAAYRANALLLVRLARAFRNADLDGVLARISAQRAAGSAGDEVRALAKTALMGKHLVESGATDGELAEAAAVLGISDEIRQVRPGRCSLGFMATYRLINTVVGPQARKFWAGTRLDSAVDDVAGIQAAGGSIVLTSNSGVQAAGIICDGLRLEGASEERLNGIMTASMAVQQGAQGAQGAQGFQGGP